MVAPAICRLLFVPNRQPLHLVCESPSQGRVHIEDAALGPRWVGNSAGKLISLYIHGWESYLIVVCGSTPLSINMWPELPLKSRLCICPSSMKGIGLMYLWRTDGGVRYTLPGRMRAIKVLVGCNTLFIQKKTRARYICFI